MNHAIIIDVVTIIVMCIAVFYAARLNQALMRARDGRSDLAQLITSLTEAHTKAEAAIKGMKVTAVEYDAALQKQITISRGLIEELAMMNESSNALANRLERLAPLARGTYEGGAHPTDYDERPRAAAAPQPATLRADRAERTPSSEARNNGRGWLEDEAPKSIPAPQSLRAANPARSEPVSERKSVAKAAKPAVNAAPVTPAGEPGDPGAPRSRAEQELFAAIETLRKGRQ